jgi:outer membrane biosynthesis protein TonB
MKKVQSLWFLSALALFLSVGISLSAQETTTPPASTPDTQAQPAPAPDQTQPSAKPDQSQPTATPGQSQTTPSQTPDEAKKPSPESQAPSAQPADTQSFSGTVVKAGDKYVLQDDSGKTYDIDHQDEVAKFEGKRVKVHGTLDASGKMIHVQ